MQTGQSSGNPSYSRAKAEKLTTCSRCCLFTQSKITLVPNRDPQESEDNSEKTNQATPYIDGDGVRRYWTIGAASKRS